MSILHILIVAWMLMGFIATGMIWGTYSRERGKVPVFLAIKIMTIAIIGGPICLGIQLEEILNRL